MGELNVEALAKANNEVENHCEQRTCDARELCILQGSVAETKACLDAALESKYAIGAELAEERSVATKYSSELKDVQDVSTKAAAGKCEEAHNLEEELKCARATLSRTEEHSSDI